MLLYQTNRMFLSELTKVGRISRYASQTYDAVWAIALALRSAEMRWRNANELDLNDKVKTLGNFDYSKNDMTQEFMRQMEQLSFLGVSVSNPASATNIRSIR